MRSVKLEFSNDWIHKFMESNGISNFEDLKAYVGCYLEIDNLNTIKMVMYPDTCEICDYKKKDDTAFHGFCSHPDALGYVETSFPENFDGEPMSYCPLKVIF